MGRQFASKKFAVAAWGLNLLSTLPLLAVAALHPAPVRAASWDNRPDWASLNDEASTSRRKVASRDMSPIAPFTPDSHNVGIDVGQVFLMGDLAGKYADSIGSQLHYTYGVSNIFGFDSSLGYSSHSSGKYTMATFLSGLRMNLAWFDKIIPYGNFGLGFFKPTVQDDSDPTRSFSPLVFGLYGGAGVNLQLSSQLFFGASLTFHDIFGTYELTSAGEKVAIEGTYTSFFLNAGVTF